MKSILALFLTILSISYAEDDSGEKFSYDSNDKDATQDYEGLIVQVYQPDGEEPFITLASRDGDHGNVYCFKFGRLFEATGYDSTCNEDCTYDIVSNTEVSFADIGCVPTQDSDTTFSIACSPVDSTGVTATLTLNFELKEYSNSDFGVEYTIDLQDYTLADESTSFVMEQGITECSDEYSQSGDSGSESGDADSGEDDSTDEPTTTATNRRRILEDVDSGDDDDVDSDEGGSDSENEESGISSDDSNEFDLDAARFLIDGAACNECVVEAEHTCVATENSVVDYQMVYQRDSKSVQLFFGRFTCNLFVDPFLGIDKSKISNGNMINGVIGIVVGVVAMLLY